MTEPGSRAPVTHCRRPQRNFEQAERGSGHCHRTRISFISSQLSMAGLISPKPLSYLQHGIQYNPYQRAGVVAYSDNQNAAGNQLTIHTPDQSLAAMMEGSPALTMAAHEEHKIYTLVIQLLDPGSRESALLELSKKREQFDELALVLWHSFGKLSPRFSSSVPSNRYQVLCRPCSRKSSRFTRCSHLPTSLPTSPIVSATHLRSFSASLPTLTLDNSF